MPMIGMFCEAGDVFSFSPPPGREGVALVHFHFHA